MRTNSEIETSKSSPLTLDVIAAALQTSDDAIFSVGFTGPVPKVMSQGRVSTVGDEEVTNEDITTFVRNSVPPELTQKFNTLLEKDRSGSILAERWDSFDYKIITPTNTYWCAFSVSGRGTSISVHHAFNPQAPL